ncbi:MAG TPA: hypothetical protein VJ725_12835 [Thermoanaerobaculia bacterium]|nr:hypothetical protein [Thermoanaerobaculia bacterium]
MIPSPLSRIDLSTLSSHLRVIPTTPAWPTVQTAIANLKSKGRNSASFENDVRCVQEYCRLLSRSSEMIAHSLICGLMAGQALKEADREQKILIGLDAIARAYRFSEKTDLEVAETLKKILQDQWKDDSLPSFQIKALDASLSAWKTTLEDTFKLVEKFPVHDLDYIQGVAWSSWLDRTELFFHARRLAEPQWIDILAVAAAVPPATLLKLDLREMTITDWSTALVEFFHRIPWFPDWCGFAALLALGFRPVNWLDLMKWRTRIAPVIATDDVKDWELERTYRRAEKWSRRNTAAPSRGVLVIKKTTGSLVDGWLPSPSIAAAAVTTDQALSFLDMPPPPPMLPSEKGIAFEMPLDREADALRIFDFWYKEMGNTTPPTYFAAEAIPAEVLLRIPRGHVVIAPKSVDDLFPAPTAR